MRIAIEGPDLISVDFNEILDITNNIIKVYRCNWRASEASETLSGLFN